MCLDWTTTLIPEKQGTPMRNISRELVKDKETLIRFEEHTHTSHSQRWFIMKAGKRSVWNQITDQMTLHCLLKPLRVTSSLLVLCLHQNYHGSIIVHVFFPPSFSIACVGVLQHGNSRWWMDSHPAQRRRQCGLPKNMERVQDGETILMHTDTHPESRHASISIKSKMIALVL